MQQQLDHEVSLLDTKPKQNKTAALLMIDIDDFDGFNRRYGTAEGDRALKQLADIMVMNLRSGDLACRYAGDRFISLLPNTPEDQAQVIAQELQDALQSLAFKIDGRTQSQYLQVTSACLSRQPQQSSRCWLDQLGRQLQRNKSEKRYRTNKKNAEKSSASTATQSTMTTLTMTGC